TLKDGQGNGVTGQTGALTTDTVTVPNAAVKAGSIWTDKGNGEYERVYTAQKVSTDNKALLKLTDWNLAVESLAYAVIPGDANAEKSDISVDKSRILANNNATGTDIATVTLLLKDAEGNVIPDAENDLQVILEDAKGTVISSDVTISKMTYSDNGVYTATISGKAVGTYVVKIKLKNGYLNGLDSALTLYNYIFELNTTDYSIVEGGRYQLLVFAIASDTQEEESVKNGISWSSNNNKIATVDDNGIVLGINAGAVNINATGSYNGLDFNLDAVMTVKGKIMSGVYGETLPTDTSNSYIIEPPSYAIAMRCAWIVDAMGTPENITGGGGGSSLTIDNMNEVSSITIKTGNFHNEPSNISVASLIFHMKNGDNQQCGTAEGTTNITTEKFVVEDDYVLQGYIVSGGTYIHSVQFITMPLK
uniref:invasin domain 3-containing protein n=1 Tax=Morganella morganii TaxID=582 RepID=UPI002367AE8D